MNCKNCQTPLQDNARFCANCGAKIITNRLSIASVASEFFTTYLSWDTAFFKTLKDTFIKPHVVVQDYFNGVRKRYMQPFSFILISLTLYSVYIYFAKGYMLSFFEEMTKNLPKDDNPFGQINFEQIFNNYNLITFSFLPFLALVNYFVFYKKLNFIEQLIALTYTYANYLYLYVFMLAVALVLGISLEYVFYIAYIYLIIYFAWFYKNLFKLSIGKTIWKSIQFFLYLLILYIIVVIISIIVLIIYKKSIGTI